MLRSLAAPPPAIVADDEALRDRVQGAVSALLGLVGVKADPLRSPPHILLSNLVERSWREGHDLDLATLIAQVQRPPLERIGVMDIDSFMAPNERRDLAMSLNNLVAAPGFAAWTEGEPLDVASLLYDKAGRPRLSILSIAHLSDAERMYVVTSVLNEVIAWMRQQPGTSSLRALLYMDEVAGYLPPSAMPPSKAPMLTLLKQARAFGLGVMLATQNPADLDYKALGNAGTWFLGRLQTERDKQRVIEGLTSAAPNAFDKTRLEGILSGLGARVFLMSNTHEDAPVVFQTRWALSYLAGPLTREQIARLRSPDAGGAADGRSASADASAAAAASSSVRGSAAAGGSARPVLPPQVEEVFVRAPSSSGGAADPVYSPQLLAQVAIHYVDAKASIDEWQHRWVAAAVPESTTDSPWEQSDEIGAPELDTEPSPGASFAALPACASNGPAYDRWRKMLAAYAYRSLPLKLWTAPDLKLTSTPTETEGAFRARVRDIWRQRRDGDVEKLRARYAPQLARVKERLQRAQQQVDVQRAQASDSTLRAAVSVGTTIVGAIFGRKLGMTRASDATRSVSRTVRERGDIGRAAERADSVQTELDELEKRCQQEIDALAASASADPAIAERAIAPRKSDLEVERLVLGWVPRPRAG